MKKKYVSFVWVLLSTWMISCGTEQQLEVESDSDIIMAESSNTESLNDLLLETENIIMDQKAENGLNPTENTETEIETVQGEDILTIDAVAQVVQDYYNEINDTNLYVVNVDETVETTNGYVFLLRYQGGSEANVLICGVTVDFNTGNVVDEIGNSWNIYE